MSVGVDRTAAPHDGGERGQALVEAILIGLVLLVPVVWGLAVLSDLHKGALAATAAAREAGFDAAHAASTTEAAVAVDAAVRRAFDDLGLDHTDALVRWSATGGLARGSTVTVEVTYAVTVLQPPLVGRIRGPAIVVRARHSARVDPFGSRG